MGKSKQIKLLGLAVIIVMVLTGGYYFAGTLSNDKNNADFQTNVDQAKHLVDRNGIPTLEIEGVGKVEHPAWVGLYALAYAGVENYDPNKKILRDEKKFWACINWMEKNLEKQGEAWAWKYNFDSTYNDVSIKAPWSSAFAQAVGIEAFLTAYEKSGDRHYLELAQRAAQILFIPIKDGGLLYQSEKGIWFELMPFPQDNPPHVLNGHMRTLIALRKLAVASEDKTVMDWYEKGLATLEDWLPLYDTGYWLRYDLNPRKSGLLFRFNNPYGFTLPNLAIDKITLRDPLSNKECTLDVGSAVDPSGALRIAGNDWGQPENLDGRTVRRLKPVTPATCQEEMEGQMHSPGTYFYLTLPALFKDNLRAEWLELEITYKDEEAGNVCVQNRSAAPGPAFRDMRDGDLLLSGAGKWRTWKIPVRPSDLGWWTGFFYGEKHMLYLNKLATHEEELHNWVEINRGYLHSLEPLKNAKMVAPRNVPLPTQTPMLPVYSFDSAGVVLEHRATERSRFFADGRFDPSGDRGEPVYHFFIISKQVTEGSKLTGGAYSVSGFRDQDIQREPALEWLLNEGNFKRIGDSAVYHFAFPNAYNDIYTPSGWQSAFGQAYVIKALDYARQEKIGNRKKVEAQLLSAVNAYHHEIKEGGVTSFTRKGWFAEEVPNATHVLNAHLISTAALLEINQPGSSPTLEKTIDNFQNSLKELLHTFDTGYWSRYDQNPKKRLLLQLDWLAGEKSPLVDQICLVNPQSGTYTAIDVGSERKQCISGIDWEQSGQEDGRTVRAFANGYARRDQEIKGGSRHNVFFWADLPEREFPDYFDVPPHQLIIRYKDRAAGEFAIKIQAINEGNNLQFVPLRGGRLRCRGDGEWKEAVFTIRPQDMGWYMGPDYQVYHVQQLEDLGEKTGDWFFKQYAEKWDHFLKSFETGKPVVVEDQSTRTWKDLARHGKVLMDLPCYPGYGLANALDGDADDDYVAGLEDKLPAEFAFLFKEPGKVSKVELVWENEDNFAAEYELVGLDSRGKAVYSPIEVKQKGKTHLIQVDSAEVWGGLKIIVKETVGQPRVLLRQVKVWSDQNRRERD